MKQPILHQKMKPQLQKEDIDRLQDQRKKKKTPNPPIETKNKLKIEMD